MAISVRTWGSSSLYHAVDKAPTQGKSVQAKMGKALATGGTPE
jgi:hypothetical protein